MMEVEHQRVERILPARGAKIPRGRGAVAAKYSVHEVSIGADLVPARGNEQVIAVVEADSNGRTRPKLEGGHDGVGSMGVEQQAHRCGRRCADRNPAMEPGIVHELIDTDNGHPALLER